MQGMAGTQDPPGAEARLLRAHGIVQGVGFRDNCARHARGEGITGWVRNRSDGTVEAFVQGSPEVLDRMCNWLRHHVPGARVDALDVESAQPDAALGPRFERRPTL